MRLLLRYTFWALCALCLLPARAAAGSAAPLLARGWEALARDEDAEALRWFGEALARAEGEHDAADRAASLLYLGIGSYGSSYANGLEYATRALAAYRQLEKTAPGRALEGRSRCLQLMSTIYSRQGKWGEATALSREAMSGLPHSGDSTGTLGLIYNSLGSGCKRAGRPDSARHYYRLALEEQRQTRRFSYLPASYINVADLMLMSGDAGRSRPYYDTALRLADSTGNRQAQVQAHLALGRWQLEAANDEAAAALEYDTAFRIADSLRDPLFKQRALESLLALALRQQDYQAALARQTALNTLKDSLYARDKQHTLASLEVQFEVAEKDRQLRIIRQEHKIAQLTNALLWGAIALVLLVMTGVVLGLRRLSRKDRQLIGQQVELLRTQEALQQAEAAQHRLEAQQLESELEHRESRLSALTLQMVQKNELMQELKLRLEKDTGGVPDAQVGRIINRGLNQDKDWADFNRHFESINKHFYSRLKAAYPDIGPNDLRICALIKMNLSSKEMAAILNISPDSVKTARYRLRKKLRLNTEDNLTDFILTL